MNEIGSSVAADPGLRPPRPRGNVPAMFAGVGHPFRLIRRAAVADWAWLAVRSG